MRFLNTNKKKNLLVFLFAFFVVGSGLFLLTPSVANAAEDATTAVLDRQEGGGFTGWLAIIIKAPLYGLFVVFGWFASAGLTLLEWVIKSENISGDAGLLNQPNIYELWQFVRDFFNIFFIFGLLYIAFTTVFQIQKNFKKALLSLVLAALFVNFSYPITRVLIDATNVPMYFFFNQIAGTDPAKNIFSGALSITEMQHILLPGSESTVIGSIAWIDTPVARFLVAVIFMFVFAVTLFVIAMQFIVRLVAFMILLVFSSVGFVAFIVPGMEEYGKMWWKNFWKYALYGPAAALMLLVATRFFHAMAKGRADVFASLTHVSGNTATEPTFIASIAMFSFSITILWFAIGLGQKMGLAGAATISGKGEKFVKWAAKKTYDNPLGRGLGGGIKERAENSKVGKFFTPKYWSAPSEVEAGIKGGIMGAGNDGVRQGWTNARAKLAEDQHNKKVTEEEKKMEEARTSETQLRATMADRSGRYSKAQVEAAARILSKKDKLQNAAHMGEAAAAMQYANRGMNPATAQEKTAELVKKAGGEIYQNGLELATAIGRLGTDTKAISSLIDKAEKDALNTMTLATYSGYSPAIQGKLSGKMKKEGAISVLVEEKVTGGATRNAAVTDVMTSMKPEDAAKVFKDPAMRLHATAYLAGIMGTNPERYTKIKADV